MDIDDGKAVIWHSQAEDTYHRRLKSLFECMHLRISDEDVQKKAAGTHSSVAASSGGLAGFGGSYIYRSAFAESGENQLKRKAEVFDDDDDELESRHKKLLLEVVEQQLLAHCAPESLPPSMSLAAGEAQEYHTADP